MMVIRLCLCMLGRLLTACYICVSIRGTEYATARCLRARSTWLGVQHLRDGPLCHDVLPVIRQDVKPPGFGTP